MNKKHNTEGYRTQKYLFLDAKIESVQLYIISVGGGNALQVTQVT